MYDATLGRFLSRDPLPPGSNAYIAMGDDPPGEEDPLGLAAEKECQAAIAEVKKSRWFQALETQFKASGCTMPPITCDKEARGKLAEADTGGYYDPKNNSVHIIYPGQDVKKLARIVVHELVHAYDECKGLSAVKADARGLDACTELRAYLFSGQCNTPEAEGGLLMKGESPGDCLLRKAQDSIRGKIPEAAPFGPKDDVCCAWQYCACAKNPPGTGFFEVAKMELPKMPSSCKNSLPLCQTVLGPEGGAALKSWFEQGAAKGGAAK